MAETVEPRTESKATARWNRRSKKTTTGACQKSNSTKVIQR